MGIKAVGQSRGNSRISIEVIEALESVLDKLEPKPKPNLSQSEKLFKLRHKIERVLRLGYSYEEIAFVLKQQDIIISSKMLESYLKS